jgi:glutamate formiminotransferase/formiminotetrahydrofolate cyclodeaminase
MQVVECVPNFSEGRDDTVIGAIAAAVAAVPSVHVLDVDKGAGANRTVITFVGAAAPVEEAAFQAIRSAGRLIDMRSHRGAHPRLGATDVCPFIPLSGITMEECGEMAARVGERVANELEIPVFLYGEAARLPERKLLQDVRRGEYEGLASRFTQPGAEPDFGEAKVNEVAGATIIGARAILIAFNVNLKSKSKQVASQIAAAIRQSGSLERDGQGNVLREPDGTARRTAGSLTAVRAVGWFMNEYDCAQVSTNLIDFNVTSMHQVYEEVKKQAALLDTDVAGSELVGLVPLRAMVAAGRFYSGLSGSVTAREEDLIELAVSSLGLDRVRSFQPEMKIIEYRLRQLDMPVVI